MKSLTWRNFYELSLLSYFNVYQGNETVEDLLISVLMDTELLELKKDSLLYQMNVQSLHRIYPQEYRDVFIEEVFDDNAQSGVYCYRLRWQDQEIIAIRGSEELDDLFHLTGWQDWKDNFNMYLSGPTYQQLVAVHYLHSLDPHRKRSICGHSKGGNLSLIMAMCASKPHFDSIDQVVAINAPGITDSLMEDYAARIQSHEYQEKVTLIENEHDCISAFFHHVKSPIIVKSDTPGNTLKQLYENHQLHTIKFEQEGFIATDRKGVMPRLVHHFINDFFVKMSPDRLKAFVSALDDYFDSGLSKNELYRVLIYQISKYTSLFDELDYDEVANVTFQDLIERRKSRYLIERMRQIHPEEAVTIVLHKIKEEPILPKIDVSTLTNAIIENYETTINSHVLPLKAIISENNRKIMEAIRQMQNGGDAKA